MARRKKPENETPEDVRVRHILESVSDASSRSEKTSWERKQNNMVKLISKLRPIEQQIIELESHKLPVLDEINELREIMVRECVHPYERLVFNDDHVVCKFCNGRLSIPNGRKET